MPRLYSKSELSEELGKDRRTIGFALENLKPDGMKGGFPAYYIMTAVRAIYLTGSQGARLDANQERARKDKEMADKLQMANEAARGELIHADVMTDLVIGAFTKVRTRFLALPNKLTPRLVALRKEIEIYTLLNESINEVLTELSEQATLDAAGVGHDGPVVDEEVA